MTTRHAGYIVVLEEDIREDDAASIVAAINALRGVQAVKPVIGGYEQQIADERARVKLGQRLWEVIYPKVGQ